SIPTCVGLTGSWLRALIIQVLGSIPTCVGLTEADLQFREALSPRYLDCGQLRHTRHSKPFSRASSPPWRHEGPSGDSNPPTWPCGPTVSPNSDTSGRPRWTRQAWACSSSPHSLRGPPYSTRSG